MLKEVNHSLEDWETDEDTPGSEDVDKRPSSRFERFSSLCRLLDREEETHCY